MRAISYIRQCRRFSFVDTLTHALSGALLARATEPRPSAAEQLPRSTRLWVGFWAATFPDSDFVLRLIDPLLYLTTHRGVTHSLLLLPVWALLLALAFHWLTRRRYPWRAFVGVCALGIAAHIAGDVITVFGTMVFAPVSSLRLAWPTTFIIDPYFTAILVAGLVGSARRPSRWAARAGLATVVLYVGVQAAWHERARTVGEAHAASLGAAASVHALPQPFSPLHWLVVVEEPSRYHLAYISLWRNEPPPTPAAGAGWFKQLWASYQPASRPQWQTVARFGDTTQAVLARRAWESDVLATYRHFARLPALYRMEQRGDRLCVWFNDLRFVLVGRETPFRYGACQKGEQWRVYHYSDAVGPSS